MSGRRKRNEDGGYFAKAGPDRPQCSKEPNKTGSAGLEGASLERR
jgi:hypothetical protein